MVKRKPRTGGKKSLKKSSPKYQLAQPKKIKIRVIGIGGGGCSIVSELASRVRKVSFVAANTDSKTLKAADKKVMTFQFGESVTRGWGTGMNPDLGKEAALKDKERIKKLLAGFDLCILVSSLGGGTGSGAAPIFAKISKDLNNITYGIFTLPFKFEGEKKKEIARNSLRIIRPKLDMFSVIPNERIFQIINRKTPLGEALSSINNCLAESLEGLIEMIFQPALINIDFADFKSLLTNPDSRRKNGKLTYLHTVKVKRKEGTVKNLIDSVLNCQLYPYGINEAKGVLLNIAGEKDLSLADVTQISKTISDLVNKEAKIIFGVSQSKKYKDYLQTSLLAIDVPARVFSSKTRKKKKVKKKMKKEKKEKKKKEKKSPETAPKEKKLVSVKSSDETKKEKPTPVKSLSKKKKKKKKNKKTSPPKKKKEKKKQIKVKVKKIESSSQSEEKKEISPEAKTLEPRIRKNALQLKKDLEAEEEAMLAKEKIWETPAFLRKKNNQTT